MIALVIIAFVVLFAVILAAASAGNKYFEARRKRQVTEILRTVSGASPAHETKILKDLPGGAEGTALERFLARCSIEDKAKELIQQAGLEWTPSRLIIASGVAAIPGFALGLLIHLSINKLLLSVSLAVITATFPYMFVRRKRSKRMAQLEEQFPEALDFLARSMRAGHAFSISLGMLGEEIPEPLGQEIRTLFNEHNLGAPMEIALKNFTDRVPLVDVRFFASAVMLQKQTGGNLSEILTRLSYIIRERFRLKGQVKAASSHGRMTASILTALPILTCIALTVVAPGYLDSMVKDSDGKKLIGGAIVLQVLGNFFIKKIINIKV